MAIPKLSDALAGPMTQIIKEAEITYSGWMQDLRLVEQQRDECAKQAIEFEKKYWAVYNKLRAIDRVMERLRTNILSEEVMKQALNEIQVECVQFRKFDRINDR